MIHVHAAAARSTKSAADQQEDERYMTKIFKVTLTDWNGAVRGKPYRKIAIQENASLYDLAAFALSAFDFALDHSFGFYDRATKLPVLLDSKGNAPDQYGGFFIEDDEYES
jgi:hypothetical protein